MSENGNFITIKRETKETQIELTLGLGGNRNCDIATGVGFFDHMLQALFFHGGFDVKIVAKGDIEVEPHHLVEDVGIVIGDALKALFEKNKQIVRFSSFIVPMDEALAQAVVDYCGRAYLVYRAEYPQPRCGEFDMSLIREFFYALAIHGNCTLHLEVLYGENSHHMSEALFKAVGKALAAALQPQAGVPSTKGSL